MTKPASSNVIQLNSPGRERSPGQRILGERRDQLIEQLSQWLAGIGAEVAEELFILADSTRERLKQTRYLDLRADVEKDWPMLTEAFRRTLSTGRPTGAVTPLEVPDFDGLQLVEDEDLSERIVVREFAAQLAETCDEELYALDRRVAALLGKDELADGDNPLAPAVICEALAESCAALGADAEDRLLLLRRVERHLHKALPPIYRGINARLIEIGVLPDLKRTYRRNTSARTATPHAATGAAGNLASGGSAPVALPESEGILGALQRLVASRGGSGYGLPGAMAGSGAASAAVGGSGGGGNGNIPADAAALSHLFLASLDELQHAGGEATVNQVRLVGDSEAVRQMGHLETVTIDIVAMLFDFIFNDADLPAALKALVGRLQIPVLKVAMMDHGFFANRAHPARRFLDGFSGIAQCWGSAVDENDPFYAKLAELVARIQDEFESDVAVFGTALAEMELFVGAHEEKEEVTVAVAADLAARREREADAREQVQTVLAEIASRPLPAMLHAFVGEQWAPVLQKTIVECGTGSSQWEAAQKLIEDLAWSIAPKTSHEERLRLIEMLPRMLGQINRALDTVDPKRDARRPFFDALVSLHSAALKGRPPVCATPAAPAEAVVAPPGEGDILVTRSIDRGVEMEEIMLVGAGPMWRSGDRDALERVGELKRGDWVEFRRADGSTQRDRLTWISPQRGIFVFSNHRAAKATSISPEALARQLRDGIAVMVRNDPLFERALNGVLESLNAA